MKTINEYLGLKYGSEMDHRQKYGKLVWDAGWYGKFLPWIPATKEELREALAEDGHLNSIPLKEWDKGASAVARIMADTLGINSLTLAECVCILKEAARQWAEDEDYNWEDD
jgi:hypothetical protein